MNSHGQDQKPKHNPLGQLFRALALWLSGRFRFERNLDAITIGDKGETFHAFRKMVVEQGVDRSVHPGAIFQVRFKFKNLSSRANRWLSVIPIPLIAAQPGIRSKTWLLGERSGDFIGFYEFETRKAAEAYWHSLPLKMMQRRAAVGSVCYDIVEKPRQ